MYKKNFHIHFVGIGGIGMSGIATIYAKRGYRISGCDTDCTQTSIHTLLNLGCSISDGNDGPSCHDDSIDILVYSSAIIPTHPEIIRAQKRGIPIVHRSLLLAELMRTVYGIGITGSHGKTTTTSLIAHLLLCAHFDPTILVGGYMCSLNTNAYNGTGNFLVAEADESDRSLLNLPICFAVLTNIDREHLEAYKDFEDLKETFRNFLNKIPFYGKAFVCIDDIHTRTLFSQLRNALSYGTHESAEWKIVNVSLENDSSSFSLIHNTLLYGPFTLSVPGIHNIKNATAAFLVALTLEIPLDIIKNAFASFKGVERRFSYRGTCNDALVFDDYGHHPEELHHVFQVARKKATKKLTVLFQPHKYSRTQALWNDFIKVLSSSSIDEVIITDIYPASESPRDGITSQLLLEDLKKIAPTLCASYIPIDTDFKALATRLKQTLQPGDLLLIQGAGKINKITAQLIS